jgi:hypothetical protein
MLAHAFETMAKDQENDSRRGAFRTTSHASSPVAKFFYLNRRNALKSPDSEKLLRRNESRFAFICWRLFGLNSPSDCIGRPRRGPYFGNGTGESERVWR